MQVDVTFRNLSANKEIKQYLKIYAEQYLESLEDSRGLHVSIICSKSAGRKAHQPPVFECHILIRGNHLPHELFAQDESEELTDTVQTCLQSIKRQVMKTEQKWRSKRHLTDSNIYNSQAKL